MAISFPSSPSTDDVYLYNGVKYIYDGTKWISGGQSFNDANYVQTSGDTITGALTVNDEITATSGILFGTDTAAANTLDDYEEGTFTPRFKTSGGELTSPTYTAQEGQYQKVGDIVHVYLRVILSSKGTVPAGNLIVDGLPFTEKAFGNGYQGATINVGYCSDFNFAVPVGGATLGNSTGFYLYGVAGEGTANAGNYAAFNNGNLQNTTDLMVSGFYVAA